MALSETLALNVVLAARQVPQEDRVLIQAAARHDIANAVLAVARKYDEITTGWMEQSVKEMGLTTQELATGKPRPYHENAH